MTGKVNRWNKTQWMKVLRLVISVDVIATEPWLTPLLTEKVKENVALIKSIKDRTVTEIEDLILEGIRTGRRHESLQKDIRKRFDVSVSRAELIARDQVSKLNGDLTRERQRGMGLKRYTWRISRDERFRESHRIKEGKEFDWTKPPVDTGHPGQDIQCRCTVEPIFDELEATLK